MSKYDDATELIQLHKLGAEDYVNIQKIIKDIIPGIQKAKDNIELYDLALEALHQAKERENPQPLTLEQLKERVGKPVYEKHLGWFILYSVNFVEKQVILNGRLKAATAKVADIELYDHEPKGK